MTPEVNLSLGDNNEDIADHVADVLRMLSALLGNQRPEYQMGQQEYNGLWIILTACEYTLEMHTVTFMEGLLPLFLFLPFSGAVFSRHRPT